MALATSSVVVVPDLICNVMVSVALLMKIFETCYLSGIKGVYIDQITNTFLVAFEVQAIEGAEIAIACRPDHGELMSESIVPK